MNEAIIPYIIIFIIVFPICLYFFISIKRIFDNDRKEKERKWKAEEYNRQKKIDIEKVIDFAKKNNFYDIEELIKKRDTAFSNVYIAAVRNATTFTPIKPTYSKGVVKGSLADNVAYLANIQKKTEYEKRLNETRDKLSSVSSYPVIASDIHKQIIEKLEKLPNSDKYIIILQRYFDDDCNSLAKISNSAQKRLSYINRF